MRSPVLAWSGNNLIPEIGERAFYSVDMLFVIGVPFYGGQANLGDAAIGGMYAGDILVGAIHGAPSGETNYIGNLGGADTDFTVLGVFYTGSPSQDVTDGTTDGGGAVNNSAISSLTLAGVDRTLVPGYRNQIVFWGNFHIGVSPAVPSISFDVTSLSTGTVADMGVSLPHDADPAAVIYDLLTSPWGKLALSADKIDVPSFQAAALTLFNEGHGYSRAIEQTTDATEIINDVLRQIDAVMYQEPTTGKLVLKLIRNDYVVSALPDINPDNMESPGSGWYVIQGWSETLNQVRLSFTDRVTTGVRTTYADGIAVAQNMANVVGQGSKLRALELRYEGCCDRALAQKLASRELAVVSRPVAKATVVVNRSFHASRMGDAVTLTWPQLGIDHMVMRIASINFGQLHDGKIRLDLIRDIFDQSLGAFPVP